jgi:hypothetical protein
MSTPDPLTKLQQVAQRNGNGPRVPRLPADRQAIADEAAARILRLAAPGRHRNTAPIPINGNSVEESRAECRVRRDRPRLLPRLRAAHLRGARGDAPSGGGVMRRERVEADDVAMVNGVTAVRTGDNMGWFTESGRLSDPIVDRALPLVVIDPEDREQVDRLVRSYHNQNLFSVVDDMQAALREFADPKPPKPAEPTGLGAVVEDADGSALDPRRATHPEGATTSSRGTNAAPFTRLVRSLMPSASSAKGCSHERRPRHRPRLPRPRELVGLAHRGLTDDQRAEL